MKTFTARDFNEKRQQIREAIKEGGCIIEYKLASREPDFKAVILPIEVYNQLSDVKIAASHPRAKQVDIIDLAPPSEALFYKGKE